MNKLLHGIILSGALLAVAHPAHANTAAAAGAKDKDGGHHSVLGARARARSDMSIQAVFYRNRKVLYHIYLRELKKDPAAGGRLVLEMTIEPDGHVSACRARKSTVNSPALVQKIVDKVRSINFGAEKGIPRITIGYPIQFLPPS